MAHVVCSGLAYGYQGGDLLFEEVGFRLSPGSHAGLVGANGVGKSTLLALLAGELRPTAGEFSTGGRVAWMRQDLGIREEGTVRELLLAQAPSTLRGPGAQIAAAEQRLAAGDDGAGMDLGIAIGDWSDLGGYELEAQWDVACRRSVGASLSEIVNRPAASLSGGERKQLVVDLLLASDADVLLLDEPDNFLDIPAKLELEERLRETRKTLLLISHDRDLLASTARSIVTLEGGGSWTHDGSYETYPEARAARQAKLGDAVKRWKEEERRLRELTRKFKERARFSSDWAARANAAESRWRRFSEGGPPPAPVVDRQIKVQLRGADSARRVLVLEEVELEGLLRPLSEEIYFGERVGVVGLNGAGKTHLMRVLAGELGADRGQVILGPRVSVGHFSQFNTRPDLSDQTLIETLASLGRSHEASMRALARYGIADAGRRSYETLSGGQKARFEILLLELKGHNLLLLDEPTDNLDIDSSEALEGALESFQGTVVATSHDRRFLRGMERFLSLGDDGEMTPLPDYRLALERLTA